MSVHEYSLSVPPCNENIFSSIGVLTIIQFCGFYIIMYSKYDYENIIPNINPVFYIIFCLNFVTFGQLNSNQ